jgi:hypothetical protein
MTIPFNGVPLRDLTAVLSLSCAPGELADLIDGFGP